VFPVRLVNRNVQATVRSETPFYPPRMR
jgi:hypothetical protein